MCEIQKQSDSGSFNTELRAKLRRMNPDNHGKFLREFIQMDTRANMDEFKISELENPAPERSEGMDEQLQITINYEYDDYLSLVGDSYLMKLPMPQNPYAALLSEKKRNYPVAIGENLTLENEIRVNIPDRFIIQSIPENAAIKADFGEISVKYKRSKNGIVMTRKFVLNQPIIEVWQVPQLKQLVGLASSDKTKYIMLRKVPK